MKEIKINRLTLENFKCHRMLNLDLRGQSVTIYGRNGVGKSSVYDGFVWGLFGKTSSGDTAGDKGTQIKPVNEAGEVNDHKAITAVEIALDVNGEEIVLRREMKENWTTHRGSTETVYAGNTTSYYCDGIPMKKNAYDGVVKNLVSEELFRCLTDLYYFTTKMKWQEKRALLFAMTGTLTDGEIMAGNEEFSPLLDSLGKHTLVEYKTKLLRQKNSFTGVQKEFPARINECSRTLQDIAGIDFTAAREEEQALTAKRDGIHVQLLALDQDTVLEKKRLELREAKFNRDQLESRNRVHRESQRKNGRDLTYLYNEISREQAWISSNESYLAGARRTEGRYARDIQEAREEWIRVNGEAFAGGKCPTCGQALPFEQLQAATEGFNKRKEQRLAGIQQKAQQLQEEQALHQKRVAEIQQEIDRRKAHIQELEEQIRKAKEEVVPVTDLPEYAECIAAVNASVDALQAEISSLMADSSKVREQLRSDLNAVDGQLRFVQGVLAKEVIKAQTEKRIEQLRAEAQNAADALEKIERMLYLTDMFTRYKAGLLEQNVNDHFRITTFRVFRNTLDNGLEDICEESCNGVAYSGLNAAMKVNVGIDIINALSRHYGVRVPLFVDGAESINELENADTQVICLKVTDTDKELRIV